MFFFNMLHLFFLFFFSIHSLITLSTCHPIHGPISNNDGSGVIAFDCNRTNLEVLTYDLGQVGECSENINKSYHETRVQIQVIQVKEHKLISLKRCKLITTTLVWHCGMHSHTTIANFDIAPRPIELTRQECKNLHQSRNLVMDGQTYPNIKLNATTIWSSTIIGSVWGEGNCEGGTFKSGGYTYKNVVVKKSYTLTVQDQMAHVKLGSEEIIGFGGVNCKTTKDYCYDHEIGTMYWDIDHQDCAREMYENLYAGYARKITTDLIGQDNNEFVHLKSTDKTRFQLFTPIVGMTSLCGREVYTTPYNGLYLVPYVDVPRFNTPSPITVNLDLIQYIEAKFMTFAYGMTLTTHQIVKKIAYNQCLTHRETLLNRLHIVASNPSSANLLVGNKPGIYGRVAGEVIHILNCPAVEVTLRKPSTCTLEIPILYRNQSLYMDPRTRIIMDVYTSSVCSPLTPVMFRHGDHWLKMDPSFSYANNPKVLTPYMQEYAEFQQILSYAQGGIYDPEDLKQLRDFMLFSVRREVMESNVLSGLEGKQAPKYDLTTVISQDGWKELAKKQTEQLWGVFVGVGEAVSGLVGIYFFFIVIRVSVGILIRAVGIYKEEGWSWKLLAGCWSVLTHMFWLSKIPSKKEKTDQGCNTTEHIEMQTMPEVPIDEQVVLSPPLYRSNVYPQLNI